MIAYEHYSKGVRDFLAEALEILGEEYDNPSVDPRHALNQAIERLLRVETYFLQNIDE